MGLNLAQKIIKEHLVSGEMVPGTEISIRIRPDPDTGFDWNNGLFAV